EGHPLVVYARQPAASIVHLFNFVASTRPKGERIDWVNQALFAELLSRVEGDALESTMRRAVERGVMRQEEHGKKAGFIINREQEEVRTILGEFDRLNGEVKAIEPPAELPALPPPSAAVSAEGPAPAEGSAEPAAEGAVRKRTRRGRRRGRDVHGPPPALRPPDRRVDRSDQPQAAHDRRRSARGARRGVGAAHRLARTAVGVVDLRGDLRYVDPRARVRDRAVRRDP